MHITFVSRPFCPLERRGRTSRDLADASAQQTWVPPGWRPPSVRGTGGWKGGNGTNAGATFNELEAEYQATNILHCPLRTRYAR